MRPPQQRADGRPSTPILAVDDTPANLLALSALLEPLGLEPVTASSGQEALNVLNGAEFAVVLLDMQMPKMDGFEVLAAMRARGHANTPVILLTAYEATPAMMKRAYGLGAFDFLTKPVDVDAVRGKVAAFVALYENSRALRRQAEALQAKDRFIGILAHDLRAPITVVSYAARLLADEPAESVRRTAARLSRAAARMDRLTSDLLDYARASAQSMPIRREDVDLGALCRGLVDDFAASSGANIVLSGSEELVGRWDRDRLQQVLVNLLSNAAKFGDGRVRVDLSSDGQSVTVRVSNGGQPIEPHRLARIFEPFEQGDAGKPGVGLGLYIVREIVHAHGGKVTVSSNQDETCFCLALPMREGVDLVVAGQGGRTS